MFARISTLIFRTHNNLFSESISIFTATGTKLMDDQDVAHEKTGLRDRSPDFPLLPQHTCSLNSLGKIRWLKTPPAYKKGDMVHFDDLEVQKRAITSALNPHAAPFYSVRRSTWRAMLWEISS